jgi:hypothetical protein
MADQPEKLKLGKGASFFVKTQLRRLGQEDETWEADFFPVLRAKESQLSP